MNGWIKLHRKIIDNPVFDNPDLFHLFVYCLIAANHNPTMIVWNGEEKNMERGSFITGRKSLSEKLKQSESKIYRNLKTLEKLNIITQKSNNRFTLINVVNYCNYQGSEFENEQQTNNQRTTDEQQMNTVKNIRTKELKNKDLKDLKHTCDSPPLFSPDFEEFWKHYPHFNRNKKGAYKNYLATLKGDSRLHKATLEGLLRAAKNYATEVSGKDKQYVLHASTFLGPTTERWFEYDKPLKNSNGETLRDDVDKNDFMIGGGPDIDYKAYERARRGYDPYTPKRGRETDSAAGVGRTERA